MISVIMSVYKEPTEWLKQSVESILCQTITDIELIIVLDNPANIGAKALIERYMARDKRIKFIINEQNLGLPTSLNRALTQVSGEYTARMDADDISKPYRLQKQLEYLKANKLDLVGSPITIINTNGDVLRKQACKSYPPKCLKRLSMLYGYIPHPTWFAKTAVFNSLNGYRRFKLCEDHDFLLRVTKAGFSLGMCTEALLEYRSGGGGITDSNSLMQLLTSKYLCDNFNRIEAVSQAEIDSYISRHITKSAKERYKAAYKKLSLYKSRIGTGRYAYLLLTPLLAFSKFMLLRWLLGVKIMLIKAAAKVLR